MTNTKNIQGYKAVKEHLEALRAEDHRMSVANDNYHRSGDHAKMQLQIVETKTMLDGITIDCDGKYDREILAIFSDIAMLAGSHEDFSDTGHVFPSKNYDKDGKKYRYGLVTWVANIIGGNSAPFLDDVQRTINVMHELISSTGYRLENDEDHTPTATVFANGTSYDYDGCTISIALACAVIAAKLDEPVQAVAPIIVQDEDGEVMAVAHFSIPGVG